MVERVGVVQLEEVPHVEEGEEEPEPLPHPRVEAVDGDVHVAALAQGSEIRIVNATHGFAHNLFAKNPSVPRAHYLSG